MVDVHVVDTVMPHHTANEHLKPCLNIAHSVQKAVEDRRGTFIPFVLSVQRCIDSMPVASDIFPA